MKPKNILIIAPSWVGDFIIAQSLLIALKAQDSNAKITVFAGAWAKDLASRMPEIDYFIENSFNHGSILLKKRYIIAKYIQKQSYTHVYVLPMSLKSALIPFFAKIPNRIGFIGESRYLLLNQYYRLDKQKLPRMVDRFFSLAQDGQLNSTLEYPRLTIDLERKNQLLAQFKESTKLVFLCPAVEYGPSKQWPWSHFATLAELLINKGFSVVLLGSNKDISLGTLIESAVVKNNHNIHPENLYNLIGKTSLPDVIDLMAAAKAVVANDSGLLHIAAASFLGNQKNNTEAKPQKIIAIYGSIPPTIAPPLYDTTRIVYLGLPCSPCGSRTCKFGHYHCMTEILPQNIADMI